MRPIRALGPDSRLGEAMEMFRMGPYRVLPIVANPDADTATELLGVLTESSLVAALIATEGSERIRLRQMPVLYLSETPPETLAIGLRASEAAERLDATGFDALPITDYQGRYLGMVARSDLAQELIRPFRPPMVGGMATPIGVYLTTGGVTGGVSSLALGLTGFSMSLACLVTGLLSPSVSDFTHALPTALQPTVNLLAQSALQIGLFLGLIRFSPMAGYHAAEHQVVHAIERGEPLLIPVVRQMPRVHPRCGTNLAAGIALFWTLGATLEPLVGSFSFVLSGILALTYWRTVGSWMQEYVTTRPATDPQLESGIRAANELLERYGPVAHQTVPPHVRLWNMGFLQISAGFFVGYALLALLAHLFPSLSGPLRPLLENLI